MTAPITTTSARAALPRTLAGLASHPWVESIDDGRATGDNLCVYLRPGYVWAGTTSAVIEPTVRDACRAFKEVAWDPAAWGQACGASAAEVAELTGEATSVAPASIAGEALRASAALNVEGEAATARALAGIGRIRAGLSVIEALDRVAPPTVCQLRADAAEGRPVSLAQLARSIAAHPRPVLPGEATPPPAPSHGEAAPALPVLRPEA